MTRRRRVGAGVACLVAALLIALLSPRAALAGWLAGFILGSALPLGALLLVMMLQLIPGAWRSELLQPAQDMLLALPMAALMVVPILVTTPTLYPWASQAQEGWRAFYLSPIPFALRGVVFFIAVIGLAVALLRQPSAAVALSAVGLIGFVLADTTVLIDWLMSLDPAFHSSGFGLYALSIQATVALAVLVAMRLVRAPSQHTEMLAGLLLTALLIWDYLAFMQFFITWSDNLPDGARWYLRHAAGGWLAVEWLIAISHLIPTFLLMLAAVRASRRWLIALAAVVIVGKAIEIGWLIFPEIELPAVAAASYLFAAVGLVLAGPAACELVRPVLLRRRIVS